MGFFRRKPKPAPRRYGVLDLTVEGTGLLNKGVSERVQVEVAEWSQPKPGLSRVSVIRVSGIGASYRRQVEDLVPSLVPTDSVVWLGE